MSDRWPAEITIGGDIPRSLRRKFAEVVADTGGSRDWGSGSYDSVDDVLKEIEAGCPTGGGLLLVRDDQARYGGFPQLEVFCIEHGIFFDHHSDAYAEYDGQNSYYRGNDVIQVLSTQCGEEVVRIEHLRKILAEANEAKPFDDSYVLLKLQEYIELPDPLTAIRWVNHR